MLPLYFHYTDNSYDSDDIPLSQLVIKRKADAYEEEEILEDDYYMFWYASVMFLKCSWFCFIMLLLYFHYTYNSYDSDDIPLYELVLKRKAEAYDEEEILEDEQKEDEEFNIATDDEGMCIRVWFV